MKRRVRATSAKERVAIEARYMPSARELFPVLRERLLASRPVLEPPVMETETSEANGELVTREFVVEPAVYGKPTFRNVITEGGEHV